MACSIFRRFHLMIFGGIALLSTPMQSSGFAGNLPAPTQPTGISPLTPQRQKELFDALDLSSEPLKAVRDAASKGDYPAADRAWADYLRQRNAPWTFDYQHPVRDPSYKNHKADDAVAGKVVGGGVKVPHTWPDNNIDWLHNETATVPPLDYEWQWQLCRMGFWNDLADAYRATGDEKYAQAWTRQLLSFLRQCPVPDRPANHPYSGWRTLEAGIRMETWPEAFYSFLESPSFTDEDVALYTLSCLDHGRYLRKFQTSANWLTSEMNGLYTDGSVFSEFREAKDWRDFAANELYRQERVQFLPDGAQIELSTGYHNISLNNVAGLARTAKRMGRFNELPADYVSRMERAFDFDLYLMTPDRSLPLFNDSGPVNIRDQLRHGLEFFPDRTDFLWAATDGEKGAPPNSTSHAFLWAGFVAMRSGWGKDANYAAFRIGSIGYGHCQQDKLDFLIWAYGTQVLYASGGGSYEMSKWRNYAIDTFSHNCVLVDGKPQRRQTRDREANIPTAPLDARWQSTPDFDFAAGTYSDGYGDETSRIATQTRRVLFVKPDLFIVADTLTPNDTAEHSYQARWQLLPTQIRWDKTTNEVTTTAPGQPNLAVVPLDPQGLEVRAVTAQTEPELLGWNVRKDRMPEYVPATTVTHTKTGAGTQNFLTLFMPIKTGGREPVRTVTPKNDGTTDVALTDGRILTIHADTNPGGNIVVTETLANGAPGRAVTSHYPPVSSP